MPEQHRALEGDSFEEFASSQESLSALRVPVATYGLRRPDNRIGGEIVLSPPAFARDVEVPLASVWTWQELVDPKVVEMYAALPADAFSGERAVSVTACYDGTFETHGNHRTAAALVRGDTWLRARIRRLLVLRGAPFIEGEWRWAE